MALSDSGRAIGAVTRLVREHLIRRGFSVSIGKPEQAALTDTTAKLNLFLYETGADPSLRNVQLQDDQPAPLWLVLKYLITAFDDTESSDSAAAHELLGRGLSALHEMNFLRLDAAVATDVRLALENNPDALKVTFDEAPADLISKIMQGTDEKYRLSAAFQVRPVMIVPGEPPAFSQLVGVDYTAAPPAIIGRDGVGLAVLASLGPRLERVDPPAFEPGAMLTITGDDLHISGLECWLGSAQLSIVGQQPDRLRVRAEGQQVSGMTEPPVAAGRTISAGEHALVVRQLMPNQRYRGSNLLAGRLRPVVTAATVNGAGSLIVDGTLLGTWDDDLLVAILQNGSVVRVFETGLPPPPPSAPRTVVPSLDQHTLTIADAAGALGTGTYQVTVRVNGQQARLSPAITVS